MPLIGLPFPIIIVFLYYHYHYKWPRIPGHTAVKWFGGFPLQCLYQLLPLSQLLLLRRLLMACHVACRLSVMKDRINTVDSGPHVWESSAIIGSYHGELFNSCHEIKQCIHLASRRLWLSLYPMFSLLGVSHLKISCPLYKKLSNTRTGIKGIWVWICPLMLL